MENWIEKKQCTGCGACSNVCPKKAITMVEDESGFKHPIIDKDNCVDCGMCKKTCPILEKKELVRYEKSKAYAGWSKDKDIRYTSTSGGMFTEIVSPIIIRNGFVIGASYNEDNMVEHRIASSLVELENLKQSKYLQSETNDIFKRVKELLDKDKEVAFCGSPCQIAALYKFLKKDYNNLLTIEFICRGMNSPKAYKSWIREIELKENKKVVKVWFKYKINGWKTSPRCTRLDFTDGTNKVYDGDENLYMTGYLGPNLYIRPSCGNCHFNGINRQADITLADFWGVKKELDNDEGTSLILINSERGQKYFDDIKENIFFEERSIQEIYEGNVCFTTSVIINKKSEEFLSKLNDENFSELVKKYSKKPLYRKVLVMIKRFLSKIIGIKNYDKLRKFKNK